MKLTDQQQEIVDNNPSPNLLAALELADDGWNVFPLRPGSKVPLISKKEGGRGCHDGTTDAWQIIKWWTNVPNAGIGANLGDDRLAFDIDLQNGGRELDAFPTTRTHLSGRGNGNKHLIYRFDPNSRVAQLKPKTAALGRGIDVKVGRGAYIVMPPTRHEATGQPYTIADTNDQVEHRLTDFELDAILGEANVSAPGDKKALTPSGDKNQLSDLLRNPPAEGGRNDWLAKVAGYYAKKHREDQHTYNTAVELANNLLDQPLEEWEVAKTADSIWEIEQRNHPERAATIDNGYLTADGPSLLCQTLIRQGDQQIPALGHFADFDIEAVGIAIDTQDRRTYWVRLHTPTKAYETTIPGETFGDDRAIRRWLAARGLTIDPPINAMPRTAIGVRLMRYLNAQNPAKVELTDVLGWDDTLQAFVTHEGLITSKGLIPKEQAGVVANPVLIERDVAPYAYGFEHTAERAQAVLREILTFQDEKVTAVFGSWWAACLLKPQIQARTSLFPFFGVEAVSESGKTNGFFDLMVQLNGNTRGEIAPTRPVLRDFSSVNKSGIVWADDLDDLAPYGELLRAATSGGVWAKMDIDRTSVKNTQLVNPIFITGEALGMSTQKALMDRSIVIDVPSPKGRKSTRGDWAQWEDVLDLKASFPDGRHVLSGWYLQQALGLAKETVEILTEEKKKGQGRHGDKLAVLRAGAHLLEVLTGQENAYRPILEEWITDQELNGWLDKDNTLTVKLLPWALRTFGYPKAPQTTEGGRFDGIDTPAFIKDTEDGRELWVSIPLLAQAWSRDQNNRVEVRTESEAALKQQADALGTEGGKAHHVVGSAHKHWFRRINKEYTEAILNRSQGIDVRKGKAR